MELERSAGAHVVPLAVQLHLFRLSILRIPGSAAQEVDAVREAQLPALRVGFKMHQQHLEERGGKEKYQPPDVPTRAYHGLILYKLSKRTVAVTSSKLGVTLHHG